MADSIQMKIMDEVKVKVDALALSGLAATDIMKVPREKGMTGVPGVITAPYGSKTIEDYTNAADFHVYPTLVAVLDDSQSKNTNADTTFDRDLLWHESIINAFLDDLQWSGISGQIFGVTTITPLATIDPSIFRTKKRFLSGMVLNVRHVRRRS